MPTFRIVNGIFTSDSLIVMNGRVVHKDCTHSEEEQEVRKLRMKTITNLVISQRHSQTPSCSTDVRYVSDEGEVPEDNSIDNTC